LKDVLESALAAAREALAKTPELLPVLKQAGVVDAGGAGYVRFLEGIHGYALGLPLPEPPKVERYAQTAFATEEFGYCTSWRGWRFPQRRSGRPWPPSGTPFWW
jgi:dihydroxyacetone kinase-like predicted kinase